MTRTTTALIVVALLAGLGVVAVLVYPSATSEGPGMNALGERYVRLVLAVGQHDPDYVDAFYGPAEWRTEAEQAKAPLAGIEAAAAALAMDLAAASPSGDGASDEAERELRQLRHTYLTRQPEALRARVQMLTGRKLTVDEASKEL